MNVLVWLKHPGARGMAFSKLYDDPEIAVEAIAEIRARGWHADGSMHGIDLRETVLPAADFSDSDLEEADFSDADLQGATYERADLTWANFTAANLQKANLRDATLYETKFYESDLDGADFTGADLRETVFDAVSLEGAIITSEQLAQCAVLYNTKMPDGSTYDGRYRLEADLKLADQGRRDLDSAFDMAEWYQVSMDDYERGQVWADEHLAALLERIDAQHEQDKLRYKTTETDEDDPEDEATYDVEVSYEAGKPDDYVSLITDVFAEPDQVQAFRRLGWNRDELLEMGAWVSALLLWLPVIAATLLALISFGYRIATGRGDLDSPFAESDPRAIGFMLSYTLAPVIAVVATLVGLALTIWSASKRQASIFTHIANAVIYVIAWRTPVDDTTMIALVFGFILAYMTMMAVGTRRSRRLILILMILFGVRVLHQLWWYVLPDLVRRPGVGSFIMGEITFTPYFLVLDNLIALLDSLIWVFLIRWGLRSWRTRITGGQNSGAIATILLALYSALTILRIPVSLVWPLIRDTISF